MSTHPKLFSSCLHTQLPSSSKPSDELGSFVSHSRQQYMNPHSRMLSSLRTKQKQLKNHRIPRQLLQTSIQYPVSSATQGINQKKPKMFQGEKSKDEEMKQIDNRINSKLEVLEVKRFKQQIKINSKINKEVGKENGSSKYFQSEKRNATSKRQTCYNLYICSHSSLKGISLKNLVSADLSQKNLRTVLRSLSQLK